MFSELLKLTRSHSRKTPLEDYTTEVLAGILKIEPEVKVQFVTFLGLPKGDYNISTQKRYPSPDRDPNCIIDLVLENKDVLCFIEMKVESKEGVRQLERYSNVLSSHKVDGKTKYLFYCTKYFEEKVLSEHKFKQIRWYEVAQDVLAHHKENRFINNFLSFLKSKRMAQELTFNAEDFITLQNMQSVIRIMQGHLIKSEANFRTIFGFTETRDVDETIESTDLTKYGRLVYRKRGIFEGEKKATELKYGFKFDQTLLYVSLYVDRNHSAFNRVILYFEEEIRNRENENDTLPRACFELATGEWGASIELKRDISDLLNSPSADKEISDWFETAFRKFKSLIDKKPETYISKL